MILRRYGSKLQSVEPDFDPRAMSEVGFRRDRQVAYDEEEFAAAHEKLEERELTATAEGPVQDEAEEALLEDLRRQLDEILAELGEDEVVVVENTTDDYPKTRDRKQDRVVEGKNRLYFHWRIEPPLRLGIYRETSGSRD